MYLLTNTSPLFSSTVRILLSDESFYLSSVLLRRLLNVVSLDVVMAFALRLIYLNLLKVLILVGVDDLLLSSGSYPTVFLLF
jgi:hypothetical protein